MWGCSVGFIAVHSAHPRGRPGGDQGGAEELHKQREAEVEEREMIVFQLYIQT